MFCPGTRDKAARRKTDITPNKAATVGGGTLAMPNAPDSLPRMADTAQAALLIPSSVAPRLLRGWASYWGITGSLMLEGWDGSW